MIVKIGKYQFILKTAKTNKYNGAYIPSRHKGYDTIIISDNVPESKIISVLVHELSHLIYENGFDSLTHVAEEYDFKLQTGNFISEMIATFNGTFFETIVTNISLLKKKVIKMRKEVTHDNH